MSELIQKTINLKIQKEDLEQILKLTSTLTDEVTICLDREGLTIRTMDPSHVALIDIAMPENMFEKYEVNQDSKIGLRIDEVLKLVKEFDKNSWLEFQVKDDNLIISHDALSYTIKLIESYANDTPLPKIPYDSFISLKGNDVKKHLSKLNVVSDYIKISIAGQICTLNGKGDNGECNIKLEKGMEQVIDIQTNDFSEGSYSIEYLSPYFKAMLSNYTHQLEFSSNKPLRIVSKILNTGTINFYLAPKIES